MSRFTWNKSPVFKGFCGEGFREILVHAGATIVTYNKTHFESGDLSPH